MRKVTLLVVGAIAVAALTVLPSVSGAAGSGKTVLTVHCTADFVNPTPAKTKGVDFGFVKCTHYGKGVQVSFYNEKIGSGGTVTVTGTTTVYAALGTQGGPYKFSGKLNGASATVTGSGKVIKGTGAYKRARGIAKVKCTTNDAGSHFHCTYVTRYTHL